MQGHHQNMFPRLWCNNAKRIPWYFQKQTQCMHAWELPRDFPRLDCYDARAVPSTFAPNGCNTALPTSKGLPAWPIGNYATITQWVWEGVCGFWPGGRDMGG